MLPDLAEQVGERRGVGDGGVFPLRLGRQTLAGPARVGVGLVETNVTNRGRWIDRRSAGKTEDGPAGFRRMPIQRCNPLLGLHRGPAIGEPELGTGITVVLDEADPVGVGDEVIGEGVWAQQGLVRRALVVEGEALAIMADGDQTAVETGHAADGGLDRGLARLDVIGGGIERRPRHQIEQIHQEQFLMLLVVMQAEDEQVAVRARGQAT